VGNASDSDLLDSLDSSQFLRSDTSDVFTSGTLTLAAGTVLDVDGETRLDGTLYMDFDGPDGTQSIFFHDGGSPAGESFAWNEALDRFALSNTLRLQNSGHLEMTGDSIFLNAAGPDATQSIYFYDTGDPLGQSIVWDDTNSEFWVSTDSRVAGAMVVEDDLEIEGTDIRVGTAGPDQDQRITFFDNGTSNNESLAWDDSEDRFRFSDDLRVDLNVSLGGTQISIEPLGGDGDQSIRFFENGGAGGESIRWDDANDRFEITDELALQGTIRTGSTGGTPLPYNSMGGTTPSSSDITSFSDLMVSADLEVGSQLYMGGDNYLEWSIDDRFYITDGLHVGAGVGENLIVGGRRLYLDAGAPGVLPSHYFQYNNVPRRRPTREAPHGSPTARLACRSTSPSPGSRTPTWV